MAFARLDIADFRNLVSIKIEPVTCGINFLYGHNGSGKTSLLEALYYLSLGRSFRGAKTGRIINNGSDKFSIFAQVVAGNQKTPIGIERELDGDIKIRIAGKDANSISELAVLTPILLINSHCHHFIDAGPIFRRKYLDWGIFYLTNDFLRIWKQYQRVLKQRNAALRGHLARKELETWTKEIIDSAFLLDQFRQEYIQRLLPLLTASIGELLILPDLEIKYQQGWNDSITYQQALAETVDKDLQLGYTQMGPHRADLKITIKGVPAKDILSRGQQKLFVCAMMLAQGALLNYCANKLPIYLIDDLPSELDTISRSKLMGVLSRQEAQVFVTAVEREVVDCLRIKPKIKVFHVEQGNINEKEAFNQCVENVE